MEEDGRGGEGGRGGCRKFYPVGALNNLLRLERAGAADKKDERDEPPRENGNRAKTHPHRPASSPSFGPPHAILRRLQNAHAATAPRLYGRRVLGGIALSRRTGPLGPAVTGMRRPVIGEYTTIFVSSSSIAGVAGVTGVVGVVGCVGADGPRGPRPKPRLSRSSSARVHGDISES